jgi:hypothetical protein
MYVCRERERERERGPEGWEAGDRLRRYSLECLVRDERREHRQRLVQQLSEVCWVGVGLRKRVACAKEQNCAVVLVLRRWQCVDVDSSVLCARGVVQVPAPAGWELQGNRLVHALIVVLIA